MSWSAAGGTALATAAVTMPGDRSPERDTDARLAAIEAELITGLNGAAEVVAVQRVPARNGELVEWPTLGASQIDSRLRAALASRGIERPYAHQAAAIEAALAGRDVVLATATASGKSLCFQVPIVEAVLADPRSRALLLFPTKALARDQVRSLRELGAGEPGAPGLFGCGVYDGDTPPDDGEINIPRPRIDAPMPYEYWRVSHDGTPFFHRLPSFTEVDQADAAAKAWMAENGRAPMPLSPAERPPEVPAVVKEYLNSGYYVTVAGEATKAERRYLRTLRGVFARKYQLEQREGSNFTGIVLRGEAELPVYWIVRETGLQKRESEGSETLVKIEGTPPPRRSRYPFKRKVTIGTTQFYEDADGLLMPAYAVGQSYKLRRPPGVGADERWIHVDLSEQVLVAYQGDVPVFTTLVSTGKEPGMTPVGVHRLQSKHVATSMRDQPIEEDAYSIEDVPWTQYFHNSVALHGAFWHGGFGLVRSHGCVNLSPADARWLFGFTEPKMPQGWAAGMPGVMGSGASAVVVTE